VNELVLITGASSGIGLSAAIECAAAGHQVVATMRDPSRREPLLEAAKERGVRLDVEQLDVTAPSVDEKVRELVLKYGPFFALVNNAGVAVAGPFEAQSDDDVRMQFETNVLGLMNTTRAFLPSMRGARRGRIINVSSTAGRFVGPCMSVYGATKHAVEGFSEGLRWEVDPFGIDVLVVAPGMFKTAIFFENQRRAAALEEDGPYAALVRNVEGLIMKRAKRAPPPDEVGRAIARLVDEPSPPFRTIVGRDGFATMALRSVMPDRLFARSFQRALRISRVR